MRGLRLSAVAIVIAISVVAVSSAASATQALHYSRISAKAHFSYSIDYGSNPDSVFNGTYFYFIGWSVNAIAVYDGRRVSVANNSMLADGGAQMEMDMTEWRGPSSRRQVRCLKPGSKPSSATGRGQFYDTATKSRPRFSGGGGIGVANGQLSVNPGAAIVWSIGCRATEGLETHGLEGGPTIYVSAPPKSLFAGSKAFSIGCKDAYKHGWDPAAGVPNAHTFIGSVDFAVKFTPFPASQLTATKKRLRDLAGKNLSEPSVKKYKECP